MSKLLQLAIAIRLKKIMNDILEKEHSKEQWFALEKETKEYLKIMPQELRDYFADSGAGEMLGMICSGFLYAEALSNYGVITDEDGRIVSWGELEEGETLEEDPATGGYKRRDKR